MTVRGEIRAAVIALAAIQVVTSLGAIALLGRGASGGASLAGAWAMVILALLAIGASAAVLRRLAARVATPAERIDAALADHARGNRFRRCAVEGAAAELSRVAAAVDGLISPGRSADDEARAIAAADRAALLHLLDGLSGPALVVDRLGAPTAASASALDRLAADADGSLARALKSAAAGGSPKGVAATRVGDGALVLCVLAEGRDAPTT